MATVNLLPNEDVYNTWTKPGFANTYSYMAVDHSGNISTDGAGSLRATATGKVFTLGFENFTEDFSTIDSVQAVVRSGNNGRGASFEIEMTMVDYGSGSAFWSAEGSGSQAGTIDYRTQTFTSRTTSDGSSAWTNTNINNLRMSVELTAHSGGTTRATYCYFIVTYTEPVAGDNAIFFGCNF